MKNSSPFKKIYIYTIILISWSCNQDINNITDNMNNNVSRLKNEITQNSLTSLDVCDEPPTDALYLYSFGTYVFYITPKLDGSSGTQQLYALGLSCFPSQSGYTCDNGPSYSGVCCFTTNSSLSCTGSKFVVLANTSYRLTAYVALNSPCVGSYMDFEFCDDASDHIQSVRFCTNECYTRMCDPDDCIIVDINN